MKELLKRFVREEEGQDLIEYALLAGLIIVVAVAVLTGIGTDVNTIFTHVQAKTTAAAS